MQASGPRRATINLKSTFKSKDRGEDGEDEDLLDRSLAAPSAVPTRIEGSLDGPSVREGESSMYDRDHPATSQLDATSPDRDRLKETFGQASFDDFEDRCDASQSNAASAYYKSHMRGFFQDHYVTKGLGEIPPVLVSDQNQRAPLKEVLEDDLMH